jgi:3-hydroxyisobutyrate dehydrogenase-like beta-hydroxyacid dehydrogenase
MEYPPPNRDGKRAVVRRIMKLAFLGTGNMGAPMARNLLRASHQVTVYNRTREKAEPLKKEGAKIAASPKEAGRDADIAITMLANDAAVEQAVFGRDGLLQGLPPGSVHLGMSTISVELAKRLAEIRYVSAPVVGRPDAAQAGKLWIVAAGALELVERCRPILEVLGRGISVVGEEPWKANMVKLGVNFTIASMLETLGESFALMRKSEIAVEQFLEVVNNLYNSPVYTNYGSIIAEAKYEPAGFAMRLGLKDVNLALAAAGAEGVPLPVASLLHDHYLAAIAQGYGDLDWAALAQFLAENAGVRKSSRA